MKILGAQPENLWFQISPL